MAASGNTTDKALAEQMHGADVGADSTPFDGHAPAASGQVDVPHNDGASEAESEGHKAKGDDEMGEQEERGVPAPSSPAFAGLGGAGLADLRNALPTVVPMEKGGLPVELTPGSPKEEPPAPPVGMGP